MKNNDNKLNTLKSNKQTGATLFTSLVFLILITIVGVSAAKVSMLDILIAGNNEQQMRTFQVAENELKELATIQILAPPLMKTPSKSFDSNGVYLPDPSSLAEYKILDTELEYSCDGLGDRATSKGGANSRYCYLYDFEVKAKIPQTSISDKHNRGAGKEKPKPGSSFSTLN